MLDLMIVPLVGLLITLVCLCVYYFIKCIQIHDDYDEIENPPPRIFTENDVKALCLRHRRLSADLKALQDEGFAALDFLNRMKRVALMIDRNVRYLDEEHEIFNRAYAEFKRISAKKRGAEHRASYENMYKEKLCKTQIKILQLLPPQLFSSHSRFFLPPSPVNRVKLLVKHVKMLRKMSAKYIKPGEDVSERRMTPSQLHYNVKDKNSTIESSKQESSDEAKMRILSMATKQGSSSESIRPGMKQGKCSGVDGAHPSEAGESRSE